MNPLKLTRLGAIGATAALLAMSGVTAEAQERVVVRKALNAEAAKAGQDGGEKRVKMVQTDGDGRSVVVELRNGELVTATLDGEELPSDRVKVEEGRVVVLGEGGKVLLRMAAPEAPEPPMVYSVGGIEGLEGLENLRVFAGGEGGEWRWSSGQPAEPPKVMLGVSLAEPDRAMRKHFNLEPGQATMLLSVYDGLPASEAGLRSYDLVVGIDGKSAGPGDLRKALADAEPGDTLSLSVIQNGKRRDVEVQLRGHDAEKLRAAAEAYREKMAAEGEEMGFFDFDVFAPVPPVPPAPPLPSGADAEEHRKLRETLLRRMETDSRVRGDEARRRAEALILERQRAVERDEAARGRGSDDQLERLEDRLERLERLLERLAEDQETKRRGGGG